MQILVDADACPVITIVERTAREKGIPVVLLCDTNHVLHSDYSEIRVIGAGADAVDFALVNLCKKGGYRGDAGLWSGGHGAWERRIWDTSVGEIRYTQDNMDQLLLERHLSKKARRASSRHHGKGPHNGLLRMMNGLKGNSGGCWIALWRSKEFFHSLPADN